MILFSILVVILPLVLSFSWWPKLVVNIVIIVDNHDLTDASAILVSLISQFFVSSLSLLFLLTVGFWLLAFYYLFISWV